MAGLLGLLVGLPTLYNYTCIYIYIYILYIYMLSTACWAVQEITQLTLLTLG